MGVVYDGSMLVDPFLFTWPLLTISKMTWSMVFQCAVIRIIMLIASEVLYAKSCPLSSTRQYGAMIIEVIQAVSTGLAIAGVIIFERRLRPELAKHKSMPKLISFKSVVGLEALQSFIFPTLASQQVFFPTPPYHVSYNDFAKGLPSFMVIWEITIAAIVFLHSFEFKPYRQAIHEGQPPVASVGGAILQTLNPMDIIGGVFTMLTGFRRDSRVKYQQADCLESNDGYISHGERKVSR